MVDLVSPKWKIENIETVLFDKDGTFVDLHFFWGKITELRVEKIIENFNLEKDLFPTLCNILGYNTVTKKMEADGITALYSRVKIIEIFAERLKEYNILANPKEIEKIFDDVSKAFYQDMSKYTKLIPEAVELIKSLYECGIKLGIVTSDSLEATYLTLEAFDLKKYFKSVIGRESSAETKESGIPTQIALKELNANPKTAIMIGDAPMDFISAQNAGIQNTILVASGQISEKELSKISKYTICSLGEIKCILN